MSKVYSAACERRSAACTEISRQPCNPVVYLWNHEYTFKLVIIDRAGTL